MATTLYYINGYTQGEIAEFLELPVTTVRNRLHTSRKHLREGLVDMVADTLKSRALSDGFGPGTWPLIDWVILRPSQKEAHMGILKKTCASKPHGIRAVGIIIHDSKVLLIRRCHDGRQYSIFPGGGVESDETVEQAVIRELMEETHISVSIKRLLYHLDLIGDSDQFFYECSYLAGVPTLGGEELEETKRGDIHEPMWVPISDLPELTLFPLEVRDWLVAGLSGDFDAETITLTIRPSKLRDA